MEHPYRESLQSRDSCVGVSQRLTACGNLTLMPIRALSKSEAMKAPETDTGSDAPASGSRILALSLHLSLQGPKVWSVCLGRGVCVCVWG